MIISRIPATKVDHFPPHFPVKIGFFYIYFYFFGGGDPQNLFLIGILLFLLIRSPCKNLKSYYNPFLGKSNKATNKNKRKKISKKVATFVCASSQGQRTNYAWTIYPFNPLETPIKIARLRQATIAINLFVNKLHSMF